MKWLLNLFKGEDGKGIITELAENIDRFVESPEDRKEVLKMVLEDRSSARIMYEKDNTLQKIFAVVYLLGYLFLTSFLIYKFFAGIELAEQAMNFIYVIWGGMSAKLNTVTDFLFGGSLGDMSLKREKNKGQ